MINTLNIYFDDKICASQFVVDTLQKQMLYKNGQIIFDKVKQDEESIKLPQYLIEDDWIDIYKRKIISFEYGQIVNALSIKKLIIALLREILEIWNQDLLSWRTLQVYLKSLPNQVNEILTFDFFLQQINQSHGVQLIQVESKIEESSKIVLEMEVSQLIEKIQDQFQKKASFFGIIYLHKKAKKIKQNKNFLPKSIRPQSNNDALSYMRNAISSINLPQLEIKYRNNWISAQKDQICFTQVYLNLGPDLCMWITIDKE